MPEPFDRGEAPEPFGSRDAIESLDRREEPEPLDQVIPEPFALPESHGGAALWPPPEDQSPAAVPAGQRGIRIAAVVVAVAVALLVGSSLGIMLAGWQFELPSLPTGTAAPPPPAAESEVVPQSPPAITETMRVERPATPPVAAERPPAELGATGAPLPPPPKPAPSGARGEASPTTQAADQAVERLLREAESPGGSL